MIRKYSFGNRIETGATVEKIPLASLPFPYFMVTEHKSEAEDGAALEDGGEGAPRSFVFRYLLGKGDPVYGLGEQARGIDKRGWIYESNNTDDPSITERRVSLYGAHNFLVAGGKNTFGVFFDCAGKVCFDVGYTDMDEMTVTVFGGADVYLIEGEDILDIVRQFRTLIGKSYIPPKWAFGFGQSRWGYACEKDVRDVQSGYEDAGMPLDMIYLDIDYMDRYKDFTVNKEGFPDFKNFVGEMRGKGVRLIPIIDAAVKAEPGYGVYDEGIKNGYFCKDKQGETYVVGVWPGDSVLPDVLNAKARDWFGSQYRVLLDQGIEGFWNDMNEPSLFYSKKKLDDAIKKVSEAKGKNLDLQSFWSITGAFSSLANNADDYRSFYHETDQTDKADGTETVRYSHAQVHNLYGYNMTRAAAEYFDKYQANKRYLLFSRSSAIGMHRYGGIWTGDNSSWWSHILLNLKMLPSLNMCGFLYVGADLGGFGDNTTEDLLLRWLALGIFTPLMRNHSSLSTRRQECYLFKNKQAFKNLLEMRYALIPYLYSEFVRCALNGDMLFKPLSFVYPRDQRAKTVEDQLIVGDSLMIAPVYEQNAAGRYVYLPERMKCIRMKTAENYSEKILEKGSYYIEIPLDEVVFFLREGHIAPLAKPARNVESLDEKNLKWLKFIDRETYYDLCTDDGIQKEGLAESIVRITVLPE